jgi:hypothetical protein
MVEHYRGTGGPVPGIRYYRKGNLAFALLLLTQTRRRGESPSESRDFDRLPSIH